MKLSTDLEITKVNYEAKTYILSKDKIQGFTDGIDSLRQAIKKLFKTAKNDFAIYTDYGLELEELLGEERAYVRAELKRMITESLHSDDRVLDVSDFKFEFENDKCICDFLVTSIYGDLDVREEVLL